MGKLTTRRVESLTEPGRYSDEDGTGFHLFINPQGLRYWILRARVDGKQKDFSLGSARKISLSAAREKARQKHQEIQKLEPGEVVPVETPTFAKAAELAHQARTVGYRNKKHVTQWLSTLETYAFPLVGKKPVNEVTSKDVIEILSPIWLKIPETARRLLQRIDRVMRWAVGNNHRQDRIDMTIVRDALPKQSRKRSEIRRMPSIPWQEMPEFWSDLQFSHSAPGLRLGLSFLILTAVRPGNIRLAKRQQIEGRTWTIPGDEMKAGEEFRTALSDQALEILKQTARLHENNFIFAVRDEPMSPDTLRMLMRRMGRTETPHGFRSTFKEWARAHGWADHLSEAALAHQDPNEVRAAYARSDLLEERRPMMQAWADYITSFPTTRSGSDSA